MDRIIEKNEKASEEHSDFWFIGVGGLGKEDVERCYAQGQTMKVGGYGVLVIEEDVADEKLFAVVESIAVKGKVICKSSIKSHYGIK